MRITPILVSALLLTVGCKSDNKRSNEAQATTPDEPSVTSKDGTKIGFETAGKGPPLILVSGALSYRALLDKTLVDKLAEHFTVYTYDRRGRGESTDVKPYAVAREIEDIDSLIANAGRPVYVYGVSSGAALAMQAAAALGPTKVARLALYEPPYGQDPAAFAKQKQGVAARVGTAKPGETVAFYLTEIGMPRETLDEMRRSPQWPAMAKIESTLRYDYEVLGDGDVPADTVRAIDVPVLVMTGEKTLPFMHPTADRIAKLARDAQRKTLAGQTHQAKSDIVVPVLVAFFRPASS